MNMKYFITASATFVSISLAQAATASLVATQRLVEGVSSSRIFFSDAHKNKSLGEVLRIEFSCLGNNQGKAVELITVASSLVKGKGLKSERRRGGRPRFSRGPMSF
ncbi:hypothetical protein [Bartonella koehlerae]|uniref:Uncharacterized protein n=1 Tax=Bartonella koehlerae C-29 TaxID=1134510 RepID=A0A067WG31_9HYPH|nr:hypothetical protein [Bartonella koehlerae]KEC55768.1 hypothetical protein O9A_00546 [Bartonella koehlerae C-29]